MLSLIYSYHKFMSKYIWQCKDWPNSKWDKKLIHSIDENDINNDGFLKGLLSTFESDYIKKHNAKMIAKEIERSWKIEGEHLEKLSIYSSVCRKFNIEEQIKRKKSSYIDGIVDITIDAINNKNKFLDKERLCNWHSLMFPTSISQGKVIKSGEYRSDPIDIIAGEMGKEKVIFSALPSSSLEKDMNIFLKWLNEDFSTSNFVKSAIAHLWFATIHPFEDGNGRLARVISDLVLYQNRESGYSFYSMSSQIKSEQREYYKEINIAQTNGLLDITQWICWYLNCINNSINNVINKVNETKKIEKFFLNLNSISLNQRQTKMIDKIIYDWSGNVNTSKWAKICSCSQDTATRDLNDLINKGIFKKNSNGPHTNYELVY